MYSVDVSGDWSAVPSGKGLFSKLLSGDFDEAATKGFRTRLVRFDPGGETFAPFVHPYWEEVYLLSGTLSSKERGVTVSAPGYIIRPPGTPHGPMLSSGGCLLLEFQYFAARSVGIAEFVDAMTPIASP